MPAVRAMAASVVCRPFLVKRGSARSTVAGVLWIVSFGEVATCRAEQNILWVTPILGDKVTRKEIERPATGFAIEHLDPEKALHRYISVAIMRAGCPIELVDLVTGARQ